MQQKLVYPICGLIIYYCYFFKKHTINIENFFLIFFDKICFASSNLLIFINYRVDPTSQFSPHSHFFFQIVKNSFVIISNIVNIGESFVMSQEIQEIEIKSSKHAGGKPKDKVWQYFDYNATKHAGHYDAKCKFCDCYWKSGAVKKLQNHLARDCEGVDSNVKNTYMLIVAKRDGVNDDRESEIFERNIDSESNILSEEQTALIDRSMLKAFVMCGLPFQIIENPYFINMMRNLRSNYKPPSRERLSNNLLNEEAIRTEIKINNTLERAKNLTLGMKLYFLA